GLAEHQPLDAHSQRRDQQHEQESKEVELEVPRLAVPYEILDSRKLGSTKRNHYSSCAGTGNSNFGPADRKILHSGAPKFEWLCQLQPACANSEPFLAILNTGGTPPVFRIPELATAMRLAQLE